MDCRKLKPSGILQTDKFEENITARGLRQSTRNLHSEKLHRIFAWITPYWILNQYLWTYMHPVNDRCFDRECLIIAFIWLCGLFHYRPGVPSVIVVAKAATCQSRGPPVALCVSKAPVTVDCTRPSGRMRNDSSMTNFYELLHVLPTASDDIKHACRHMTKQFHPDKNDRLDAKTIFQKLNNAYCTLTDTKLRSEYDAGLGIVSLITESDEKDCSSSAISMTIKENRSSVAIDIEDIKFLPLLKQCKIRHSKKPVDNGPNGLQFKFAYTIPNDIVPYGTISLKFYPSTSRLLVQGTSYLLWVEVQPGSCWARIGHKKMVHACSKTSCRPQPRISSGMHQ